ncbi:hypothetical protein DAEQUDRAFT_813476 [Daedalea quercina L-15889]|uniref:Uncharacterized protein n=1 Tax=Daedalea quercina L-15889 TaxID=1314783 RepID=A0A165N5U3_9APHY|nr:hypothetical protein DAEQUDRAFT_813476 [Daedalea quercina L-15889]
MPRVSAKHAEARSPSVHRHYTRAVAKLKEQARINQEAQRQILQTPRGRKSRVTGIQPHAPPGRSAKGKARQEVASRPSAMRKPSSSAPKTRSRRVSFASPSEDRPAARSDDDGLTDADGEYEVDDMNSEAGSNVAATDADGDTQMGDDDRGEVDNFTVGNHWRRQGPAGGVRRTGSARERQAEPLQGAQAGQANPQSGPQMEQGPIEQAGARMDGLLFNELWNDGIFHELGPYVGQLAQGGMPQQYAAPIDQGLVGMMNQQGVGAGYQPFVGVAGQQVIGMPNQPLLGDANLQYMDAFNQMFAGVGNQLVGVGHQQLVGVGHQQLFGAGNQQLFGAGNQQLFGAGNQQLVDAANQLYMGAIPNLNQPLFGAANQQAIGVGDGLFGGAANQNVGLELDDAWVYEIYGGINDAARADQGLAMNDLVVKQEQPFEFDQVVAGMAPQPELAEQAHFAQSPAGNDRRASPPSITGALGSDNQPQAGPGPSSSHGTGAKDRPLANSFSSQLDAAEAPQQAGPSVARAQSRAESSASQSFANNDGPGGEPSSGGPSSRRESTIQLQSAGSSSATLESTSNQARISRAARAFNFGSRVGGDPEERHVHGRRYRQEDGEWVDEVRGLNPIEALRVFDADGKFTIPEDRITSLEIMYSMSFKP